MNDIPLSAPENNAGAGNNNDRLTPTAERLIAARWYVRRNPADQEQLFRANQKRIRALAAGHYRAYRSTIPFEDIAQAARMGFLRAIDLDEDVRFDPAHANGASLWTYARNWAKKAIQDLIEEGARHGFVNVDPVKAAKAKKPISVTSVSTPLSDDSGDTLGDVLTDTTSQWEFGENWWHRLGPKERAILEGHARGLSLREVAKGLGCSAEWVRQLFHHLQRKMAGVAVEAAAPADRDAAQFLDEFRRYLQVGIGALRQHDPDHPRELDWAYADPRLKAKKPFLKWCRQYRVDPLTAFPKVIQRYLITNPRPRPIRRYPDWRKYSRREINALVASRPDLQALARDRREPLRLAA